jgi:outer membrane protein OmpA-like peptidoglycan-associated protein
LEQLKQLLLGPELEQLKKLEAALQELDFQSQDQETIVRRITPLFERILLERLENKDAKTVEILSQHLAKVIAHSSRHNLPELSQALQSVIAPAISKEIAANQNVMVDALYPIMGSMISKYVSTAIKEMIESINEKIEDGLSFEKFKRKIKSKITGVSETELLLEESSDALISSLFIIEKESGILIAEAQLEDKEISDPHMVASMASAIKDFINDWIQNATEKSEVQILSYGNATLYIESAGSVYLVAFLDAEPDHEQRSGINEFFASIVKKYASFFQRFNGDDSAKEIAELSEKMHTYLNAQSNAGKGKKEKEGKNPMKLFFWSATLLAAGYLAYLLNGWYFEYSLEKMVEAKTGQAVHVEKGKEKLTVTGYADSFKSLNEVEALIRSQSRMPVNNYLLVPLKQIDKAIEKYSAESRGPAKELEHKVRRVEKDLNTSLMQLQTKLASVQEALQRSQKSIAEMKKTMSGELAQLKSEKKSIKRIIEIKREIASKLAQHLGENPFYRKDDLALDFRGLNLFTAGEALYNREAIERISRAFKTYLSVLSEYKEYIEEIVIQGHSDSSGKREENLKLSQLRADAVKEYLLGQAEFGNGQADLKMVSKGMGSRELVRVNGVEDKEASRRIQIKFVFKENEIVKQIQKIVND